MAAVAAVDRSGITIDRIAGGRNPAVGETKISLRARTESGAGCRGRGQFGENGARGRPLEKPVLRAGQFMR